MNNIAEVIVPEMAFLHGYARKLTQNSDSAHDLVQDALEKAITGSAKFHDGTNLRAWLRTILRNTHISNMRKRQEDSVNDLSGTESQAMTLSPQMPRLELRDIRIALTKIPEKQREAIILSALHNLSYEEIAKTTDSDIGTVKSRICRGRRALRVLTEGSENGAAPTL